jgi:Ras-related protein Rab-40
MALRRNGMERLWRGRQVTSLHELCCHAIVASTNVYGIDKLPLPDSVKSNLKSYALTNATNTTVRPNYKSLKDAKK